MEITNVKIDNLTTEQLNKIPQHVDTWLKIGLSTDRVDPILAKPAINLLYSCGGIKPPKEILFVKGPIEAAKYLPNDYMANVIYGNNDAYFLSFYNYLEVVCGLDFDHKFDGLYAVANTCGWIACFKDLAVVYDRPLHIKMDEDNRLHCEDGPAILYLDGFSVYSWHGVRIPSSWIENKDSLTPKLALTWGNIEQRRAACEIVGWVNILNNLNSKIINVDEDPMIGTLLSVEIPNIGRENFLKVVCGTGREFAIPVPPDMKTALEANAWTYDISPDILRELEVRT